MATTLTSMNDTLVVSQIQSALKNALIPINAFSFEVDTAGRSQNDTLGVPVITDPTAQSKTAGTALTSNGTVSAATTVTLSNFYQSVWQLNEGTINSARAPDVFAALAAGAAFSIAKQVMDAACALVTASNYSNTSDDKLVVAAADFGQNDLGQLFKLAETKKLGRDRSIILNASYTGALIGESNLALILATMGSNALTTAKLPPMLGMQVYNYSALPTNSENLGGFICDKGAIAVGMAAPTSLVASGQGDVMYEEIITDPDSQIVCRYRRVGNGDGGYMKGLVDVIYGVAKVQNSIVRIVSA